MKLTKLYKEFFKGEKTGGLLLILCTIIPLIIIPLIKDVMLPIFALANTAIILKGNFGDIINNVKLIILLSSLIAGSIGFFVLNSTLKTKETYEFND